MIYDTYKHLCLLTIKKKLEFEDKLHLLNAAFQRDIVVLRAKGLHDVYVNLTHFENSWLGSSIQECLQHSQVMLSVSKET